MECLHFYLLILLVTVIITIASTFFIENESFENINKKKLFIHILPNNERVTIEVSIPEKCTKNNTKHLNVTKNVSNFSNKIPNRSVKLWLNKYLYKTTLSHSDENSFNKNSDKKIEDGFNSTSKKSSTTISSSSFAKKKPLLKQVVNTPSPYVRNKKQLMDFTQFFADSKFIYSRPITGGGVMNPIYVHTYQLLKDACKLENRPKLIVIVNDIYLDKDYTINIYNNNTTIIGKDSGVCIWGGNSTAFAVKANNVIIRNLEFNTCGALKRGEKTGPDCIIIKMVNGERVKDTWIDHCSFTAYKKGRDNKSAGNDLQGSYYWEVDGAIDSEGGDNLYISWCYFPDYDKTQLLKVKASSSSNQPIAKFLYNWYSGNESRCPKNTGYHLFMSQNFFENTKQGVVSQGSKTQTTLYKNYFKKCKDPVITSDGAVTVGVKFNNIFDECEGNIIFNNDINKGEHKYISQPNIVYPYLIPTNEIPKVIRQHSGPKKFVYQGYELFFDKLKYL